ncbi:MAG: hypothetical protein Q9M91_01685 [Candidatus Dojkabacteria bacterium]|nr:hypothetical protein [Candidatus Dojkabacteria bacterium]MDQ7020536.1 hypothetical protein [Candidatus Dojkabacteria bacterium]
MQRICSDIELCNLAGVGKTAIIKLDQIKLGNANEMYEVVNNSELETGMSSLIALSSQYLIINNGRRFLIETTLKRAQTPLVYLNKLNDISNLNVRLATGNLAEDPLEFIIGKAKILAVELGTRRILLGGILQFGHIRILLTDFPPTPSDKSTQIFEDIAYLQQT